MNEQELVSLKISDNAVKPVIEKAIQSAIIQNIGNLDDLVSRMVSLALKQKVDSSGNIPRYSSDAKYDYIEVLVQKSIQDAAQEAMKVYLADKKEQLKKALLAEMNKPANMKKLVSSFAKAAIDAFDCQWRFTCNVSIRQEE